MTCLAAHKCPLVDEHITDCNPSSVTVTSAYRDVTYINIVHLYTQTFIHTPVHPWKTKDGIWAGKKGSAHSVCPREHLKDKPVDVSCSASVRAQSGARDDTNERRKELTKEQEPGNAG